MRLKFLIHLSTSIVLCLFGQLSILSAQTREIRVATFNTSLFRNESGKLLEELGGSDVIKTQWVAEIIQRVNPDIVLLNEFDYDAAGDAIDRFHANYLQVGQGSQSAVEFPYRYVAESNTGIASCFDFNNSGHVVKIPMRSGYGEDAFGFGQFEGQYGMAVLSKYPIDLEGVRTFQTFLWKDMPGALLPDRSFTPAPGDYYNEAELEVFRLSSKSHWDLPIDIDGEVVHLLASHPTPPTFDQSEDRNGLRNHDEIRLWADYVGGSGGYLYDDNGERGGIGDDVRFVICGDQNADPVDGDSVDVAILQLLDNPKVNGSFTPRRSSGNSDTSTFGLRVDYVLPSQAGFEIVDGGIFWPVGGADGANLVGASDHRLVWMDLSLTPLISEAVQALQVEVDGADVVLTWSANAGVSYEVESSDDLQAWNAVTGEPPEVADGAVFFRDSGAAILPGRKFYRVRADFD
ncbi:MAG: hypothetical protein ACI9MB_001055 [Verrucomicrobiales bacterium]|jgi:hypothetical protein